MRRISSRGSPPASKRPRDRANYPEGGRAGSPRHSRHDRYSSTSCPRPRQRTSDIRLSIEREDRKSPPRRFRTLCVRKFSSKLSIDVVQECIFRDFSKFGEVSVSVGHLDGERAALITFKYHEDALEALRSKPSVYLHDRSITVEILSENITEDQRKPSKSTTSGRYRDDCSEKPEPNVERWPNLPGKMDPKLVEMLSKSASHAHCSASLLGVPGVTSSVMMAAAARALGLSGTAGPLAPVIPPLLPTGAHGHSGSSMGLRRFATQSGQSPPTFDGDQELKATRTLFVGSLEADITDNEVMKAFERFGRIEQIDIKRGPKAGAHSYAFVRFENIDMAVRAKTAMSGRRVRSIHCKIGYGKAIPSQCLYISGLEAFTSSEAFRQLLSRFGQIVYLDWQPGRNCAQVAFDSCEAAYTANSQLKCLFVGDRKSGRLRVDFVNPDSMRVGRSKVGPFPSSLLGEDSSDKCLLKARNTEENSWLHNSPAPESNMTLTGDKTDKPAQQLHHQPTERTASTVPTGIHPPHVLAKPYNRHHGHSYATNRTSSSSIFPGLTDTALPTLQNVVTLDELNCCLQPDIWKGQILMKNGTFYFRCLHVIGDAEVSTQLGRASNAQTGNEDSSNPTLRVARRGKLNPSWMAEATHQIHNVLSNYHRGLCLMLLLPDIDATNSAVSEQANKNASSPETKRPYPLPVLVAYLKLKQSLGVIIPVKKTTPSNPEETDTEKESNAMSVHLFAPSSFALSLLKQAAPRLSSELATVDNYMVLLAIKQ